MALSPKLSAKPSRHAGSRRGTLKRTHLIALAARVVGCIALIWTLLEAYFVRNALLRPSQPYTLGSENIFIVGIHWNNEAILRSHWNEAVLDTAAAIQRGGGQVFVSLQESGSWDNTKDALRTLDAQLADRGVPRKVILDETTHEDEINKKPVKEDWIRTPREKMELRRIPYLSRLRNLVMQPMYNTTIRYDKILFLNDVVFTKQDVANLLSTRAGDFAAVCSLDFSKPPAFYDTFALRDTEGGNKLMKTWPFFRARESRQALKSDQAVPVTSCWNGIVAMDAAPFYDQPHPLKFRGIPVSLAESHLEASECCLIHADNPLSESKGVWLNPKVRVGYTGPAYEAVNAGKGKTWISTSSIIYGAWKNRFLRWTTTPWFKDRIVRTRFAAWKKKSPTNVEPGASCIVNEMQVLVANGWAHV